MKTFPPLALLLLAPALRAGQVHVVDAAGGAGSQYTEIQAAVAAAAPGDTVLVRTGGYSSFTVQNKGLVVTTDLGAFVEVPRFYVKNVPAGQSVRIHGIGTNSLNDGPGLTVLDCAGPVWIEDCALRGPLQAITTQTQGADVRTSSAVTFHRSSFEGSAAIYVGGGPGLFAHDAFVALFDCDLVGGQGGNSDSGAELAAAGGATLDGGTIFASGTAFTGGLGASGSGSFGCVPAGDGGPGILMSGDVQVHLLDSPTTGGAGAVSPLGCGDGAAGPDKLILSGTVLEQTFPARSVHAPNPVRPGETLTLTLDGAPGDVAFLWVSPLQAPLYVAPVADPLFPIAGGVFLPNAATAIVLNAGAIASGGTQLAFPVPTLGVPTLDLHVQALVVSSAAAGGFVVSSAQGITLLGPGL